MSYYNYLFLKLEISLFILYCNGLWLETIVTYMVVLWILSDVNGYDISQYRRHVILLHSSMSEDVMRIDLRVESAGSSKCEKQAMALGLHVVAGHHPKI